jgi:phage major head subunit gpT-like protein
MNNLVKWAEATEPGLRKVYTDDLPQHRDYVSSVFNVEKSTKTSETDLDTIDVGYMHEVGENGATPYEDLEVGYATTYVNKTFKKGTSVTKELWDDMQYPEIKRRMQSLSKSAIATPNKTAFSVFRNAFTSTALSYGDAKPLCSTAHPKKKVGGTASNASGTGAVLADGSLETGILNIQEQTDHNGNLLSIGFRTIILLIPPALRKKAMVILGSELLSASPNNDVNVYAGKRIAGQDYNIELVVCPWISAAAGGSDTAWFLLAKGEHRVNFFWREKVSMQSAIDFDSDGLKFKNRGRWTYGWSGWWGIFGSNGTGSNYTG